jgi:hypothetical protein
MEKMMDQRNLVRQSQKLNVKLKQLKLRRRKIVSDLFSLPWVLQKTIDSLGMIISLHIWLMKVLDYSIHQRLKMKRRRENRKRPIKRRKKRKL